ncbi:MAG: ABC transporter substrate-binding protein, partial [Desulfurococcales archaeon]|nr:ABC transporter substrate-binding protein [Desulfurococcales archaeon]
MSRRGERGMPEIFSEVLGRPVRVPDEPRRIVSLAPAITETLYLLGLEDRIAAVSHFCNKPPEARKKPRIGSYFKVNYSKLEEIQPDLVLVTTGAQRRLALELAEKGYPVYPVELPVTLHGILQNIVIVGHVTNRTREARRLASRVAQHLETTRGALGGRAYYEIWLGGPVSAGRYSYISDALNHLGLENCMDTHPEPWVINPDPEEVRRCDPDIIIYEVPPYTPDAEKHAVKSLRERGLHKLPAAEKGVILLP